MLNGKTGLSEFFHGFQHKWLRGVSYFIQRKKKYVSKNFFEGKKTTEPSVLWGMFKYVF